MSKLQKKPSALKRGHPTLQNMNFYKFFLLLWVTFALLDPDPGPLTRLNPDPIRIRNPAFKLPTVRMRPSVCAVLGGVGETAVGSLETQQLQDWPGRGHALADPFRLARTGSRSS
jgi:hypothetical protein